jgi:hypothetical protein
MPCWSHLSKAAETAAGTRCSIYLLMQNHNQMVELEKQNMLMIRDNCELPEERGNSMSPKNIYLVCRPTLPPGAPESNHDVMPGNKG